MLTIRSNNTRSIRYFIQFVVFRGAPLFFLLFVSCAPCHTSDLGVCRDINQAYFLPKAFNPKALISFGGGHWDAGPRHSGGLCQVEYRWNYYFLKYFRPQMALIFPEFKAVFFGVGIGFEFYLTNCIVITPHFAPGVYFMGRGRNLGYPIEFRSTLEIAYEKQNGARLGCQFYHISNASLSTRNPGANALVVFLAFPIKSF